jgi:hypothetical protein
MEELFLLGKRQGSAHAYYRKKTKNIKLATCLYEVVVIVLTAFVTNYFK